MIVHVVVKTITVAIYNQGMDIVLLKAFIS